MLGFTYAILFESGRVEVFPAEEMGDISEVASDLMSGVQDIVVTLMVLQL